MELEPTSLRFLFDLPATDNQPPCCGGALGLRLKGAAAADEAARDEALTPRVLRPKLHAGRDLVPCLWRRVSFRERPAASRHVFFCFCSNRLSAAAAASSFWKPCLLRHHRRPFVSLFALSLPPFHSFRRRETRSVSWRGCRAVDHTCCACASHPFFFCRGISPALSHLSITSPASIF